MRRCSGPLGRLRCSAALSLESYSILFKFLLKREFANFLLNREFAIRFSLNFLLKREFAIRFFLNSLYSL